jgi:hypothetical protein
MLLHWWACFSHRAPLQRQPSAFAPLLPSPPLEPIRLGWSAACKRLCSADADFSQDCACSIRCTVLRTVQSMHRPAGNTTVRKLLCRKREEIGRFAPARHLLWLAATAWSNQGAKNLGLTLSLYLHQPALLSNTRSGPHYL